MKPPVFDYVAPTAVEEAVGLLCEHDFDAKILAGGQSLMPLLNMRLARPSILIDVARIPDLDFIRVDDSGVSIGAMTRQRTLELSGEVRERFGLLHDVMHYVAHPQNRNQGTVGGSLVHADPAAELPAVATALGATFKARGPDGEREIDVDEFFVTYLTTSLEPTELLTEIRFPLLPERSGHSVQEVARRHGDFALAGVVATVTLEGGAKIADSRIVMFGVGEKAVRAEAAEQSIAGEMPGESLFATAGEKAIATLEEPLSDVHATAEYRTDLARVLTRRALMEAADRAARA
ncbi:MAG: xanthine dehydrogenase family protein subunit M [Myxococcales bacterium]|nr:MAG: xanthine dehydrogenase family protein subunit M [Myxococcales bacterium]